MRIEPLIAIILVAAVTTNTVSVLLQKKYKLYNRLSKRYGAYIHGGIILPFWALFFAIVFYYAFSYGELTDGLLNATVSIFLVVISLYLIYASIRTLGFWSLVNGNFFNKGQQSHAKQSVYGHLQNPMYIGFELLVASLAIAYETYFLLVIAGLMFIGLNLVQARFEIPS
ncbi:hypothetical protein HYW35_02535 [Candidatus Saccharibacteria bacterium]|nr:hypothetical protein [Candidatus Saccharibacteria bacterium]